MSLKKYKGVPVGQSGNFVQDENGEWVPQKGTADGAQVVQLTGSNLAKKPYVGYSTDDKSVIAPDAERGDEFIELDTKDVYFYDGTQWVVF